MVVVVECDCGGGAGLLLRGMSGAGDGWGCTSRLTTVGDVNGGW